MPLYEYLCRICDTRFEARRAMSDAGSPIDCPAGHSDTTRLLSVFASVGSGSAGTVSGATSGVTAPAPRGGCGAGCGCMH